MLLVNKYIPTNLAKIRGHASEKKQILEWFHNWPDHKKPLLLVGPPGNGKTAIAHALAKEYHREIFEISSLEEKKKETLETSTTNALTQMSLLGSGKIILIDEIDAAKSSEKTNIVKMVAKTKFPVIFTANELYDTGMEIVRNKSTVIKMNKVRSPTITAYLRELCEIEGINYEETALKSIATKANGDLRVAMNDLQSLGKTITYETVKELDYRDIKKGIFDALIIIFKTESIENAIQATQNLDEDSDMLLEWMRENITTEYEKKHEIARAFSFIALGDLYRGRIRKRQFWSLMKYIYDFVTCGVAISKDEKYKKFSRYRFPSTIKKRSTLRTKKAMRISIEKKLMDNLHLPSKDMYEFLKIFEIFSKNKELRENLVEELNLSDEELQYIKDVVKS